MQSGREDAPAAELPSAFFGADAERCASASQSLCIHVPNRKQSVSDQIHRRAALCQRDIAKQWLELSVFGLHVDEQHLIVDCRRSSVYLDNGARCRTAYGTRHPSLGRDQSWPVKQHPGSLGGLRAASHDPGVDWALFLDFDGTLVDIEMTPRCGDGSPERYRAILSACIGAFDGAVAIVSGRPIAALDANLQTCGLPTTRIILMRRPERTGGRSVCESGTAPVPAVRTIVDAAPSLENGARCRTAPASATQVPDVINPASQATSREFGGMAPPAHPAGAAWALFLDFDGTLVELAGRTPIFAGDDITDEDGFAAVNRHGGIGIKVGAGETEAACRLPDVAALHEWLATIASARSHA